MRMYFFWRETNNYSNFIFWDILVFFSYLLKKKNLVFFLAIFVFSSSYIQEHTLNLRFENISDPIMSDEYF